MEICTIGFTKHSAHSFFEILRAEHIKRLVDVRLNNVSQLAGFAKRDDLRYFLEEICGADYVHQPELLAPTAELLKGYRNGEIVWDDYEARFLDLMFQRRIEEELPQDLFLPRTVLLCSEHSPQQCHRRLVLEYLSVHWPDLKMLHLPRPAGPVADADRERRPRTPGGGQCMRLRCYASQTPGSTGGDAWRVFGGTDPGSGPSRLRKMDR